MKAIKTTLKDLYLIQPKVFLDARGYFYESYSYSSFKQIGFNFNFVQDNRSHTDKKNTLRGLHCQIGEAVQTKLVGCSNGIVLDVAVDIRKGSPTYLKSFTAILSSENNMMLLVPKGFLHGFITLSDNTDFFYKTDYEYSPIHERNVIWNDAIFNIDWKTADPILSKKDHNSKKFEDTDICFTY